MSYRNLSMTTKVVKTDLLEALRKNRAEHAGIVREAREGYISRATKALDKRLKELATGRIVSLVFQLSPPIDHTSVYDTAIKMVEMNEENLIVLEASEFRNLIEDIWDWSESFYHSNRLYSISATEKALQLGY